MKTTIDLKTWDIKHKEIEYMHDYGSITTFIDGASRGSIEVDAFEGQGETYKRREDAMICITYGGKINFEGTLTELVNNLK